MDITKNVDSTVQLIKKLLSKNYIKILLTIFLLLFLVSNLKFSYTISSYKIIKNDGSVNQKNIISDVNISF
jgi:hypothetical protein